MVTVTVKMLGPAPFRYAGPTEIFADEEVRARLVDMRADGETHGHGHGRITRTRLVHTQGRRKYSQDLSFIRYT